MSEAAGTAPRPGPVPFEEARDALRRRLGTLLPSDRWTDTLGEVNNWGFAVAGAKKDSLLESIGAALVRAQENGGDLKQFQREFVTIAKTEGWSYRGSPGWRTRVIYGTNLGQSRQAGKWAQIAQARRDGRDIFARYDATMDRATRPLHAEWNGTILPPEHSWWQTHAPLNGWRCRCSVGIVSAARLRREGLKVTAAPEIVWETRTINTAFGPQSVRVPRGVDTGFGHSAGQRHLDALIPSPPAGTHPLKTLEEMTGGDTTVVPRILGGGDRAPPLPPPRTLAPDRILQDGLPAEEYVSRFLEEFGATAEAPAAFVDRADGVLAVGRALFTDRRTGALKITKQGRAPSILLCADAIRDPDEIWVSLQLVVEGGRPVLRLVRHFIARFESPDRTRAGFAVFSRDSRVWEGVTTFEPRVRGSAEAAEAYLESRRKGIRVYARPDEG